MENLIKTVIMIGLSTPSELEQLNRTTVDLLNSLGIMTAIGGDSSATYKNYERYKANCLACGLVEGEVTERKAFLANEMRQLKDTNYVK